MIEPCLNPEQAGRETPGEKDAEAQMTRLLGIMAALRHPESGCPWDVEQTFETIAPYTIEEAYEVADAIQQGDMAELKSELGDLLLQTVFHARMAEEDGQFTFADVARDISDKMVRRHPHVFGDEKVSDAEAQTANWEAIKAAERAEKAEGYVSALEGLTRGLPSLMRAQKLQKRASRIGFDWDDAVQVLDKVREETDEVAEELGGDARPARLEEEIGDLLFAVVNLARKSGVDPDKALRDGNDKFEKRFRAMEQSLLGAGLVPEDAPLSVMEEHWQAIKRSTSR
ncbi:MAG: nucleoside triphosphate pyrophosphohydrolase [Magnetovibrionaceae bacterium]